MRLLLDTHVFLWWVMDHPSLTSKARSAIENENHACLLSMASCWELAVKTSLGKLDLGVRLEKFLPEQLAINQIQLLPVELRHTLRVIDLPWHHRDPFDRLLVAQCQAEGLTLISADATMSRYGIPVMG